MLLDLKDLSQTLEIIRRARREMPDGPARNALDQQIVQLTTHINSIVGEDERLQRSREAERQLLQSKPPGVNWDMLKLTGEIAVLVGKVLAGIPVEQIWKEFRK